MLGRKPGTFTVAPTSEDGHSCVLDITLRITVYSRLASLLISCINLSFHGSSAARRDVLEHPGAGEGLEPPRLSPQVPKPACLPILPRPLIGQTPNVEPVSVN